MKETKKNSEKFFGAQKSKISDKSLLLQLLGDTPLFKILDFMIDNKGMDFTKSDISKGAGISRASLFNYWKELELYGIVKVTRQFGKTKLYTLNSQNLITKRILDLEKALISKALEKKEKLVVSA